MIDLSVASDQARIEDLLTLGVKTSPALLLGEMTLRARVRIPPGHASVTQKMRVDGTIAIHGATFTNAKWQDTVDKLSARATGNPEQAKTDDAKRVTSEMSGGFSLANAVLDVPKLNYQIPGAQVDVAGKYSLDGKTFDVQRHGADRGYGVADADGMEEHSGDAVRPAAEEERRGS